MQKIQNKKHPLYPTWINMKQRCNNPKNPSYPWYGGKGIRVCERWKSFKNFAEDMGERPDGLTLDRIESTKDYSPENCRWADKKTQGVNRSQTIYIEYEGLKLTIEEWSLRTGISRDVIYFRYWRGWNIERIFYQRVRGKDCQ